MRHALFASLLVWALLACGAARLDFATAGAGEAAGEGMAVIASDDTAISVGLVDGRPAVTSMLCRASGFDWVGGASGATPIPLIDAAEVAGKTVMLRWRFLGREPGGLPGGIRAPHQDGADATAVTFRFACDDEPSGLRLELHSAWEARPGPGPVEHRLVIYNRGRGPVLLPPQASLALDLRAPAGHVLEEWWVEKGAGTPTAEGTHRVVLGGATLPVRCWPSGRDQPRDAIPWVSVQDVPGRRGWYAGVEWTARVELAIEAGAGRPLRARIGLMRDDKIPFFTRVLPGERFDAPPARDERCPLLVNNSWGSGMAVDEPLARKMIDESADLGLELFHLDAGWFRAVGDWRADPRKFPRGLGPVADYAHGKGLKFGLWVGWTQGGDRVDPSGGGLILGVGDPAMESWFCQRHDAAWKAGEFTGATVCLGAPEAADWCLTRLRSIVKEAKLDLLEHDQTIIPDDCEREGHRHTRSRVDAGYRAAEGYYRVYDALRAENPDLLFEDCVDGGHMIDYGALRRCHYVSVTDTYDPLSNRRAFHDASYALPPAMCECYVEHRAALAGRGLRQFRYMLRSGMMGWCTIMADTRQWTGEQHEAAKREFALYKSRLRPLIREANLYHVSERPDGARWDGIEYFDPATGRGALLAFRGTGEGPEHAFALRGLDPDATYALTFEDGSSHPAVAGGRELMAAGLRVKLPERETSEVVHIERR